jgi:hypothetical protein
LLAIVEAIEREVTGPVEPVPPDDTGDGIKHRGRRSFP